MKVTARQNEQLIGNCLLRIIFPVITALMFLATCDQDTRETVLNTKPYIEYSIIYKLPEVPRLCEALNAEKQYVDIGDCRLYCEIEGHGTPLVLIHGGPGGTHHCFHPWLSTASQHFQVIYYDQRGCGLSDYKPGGGYSFEQAVDDLEKLRSALNIEKWIILGHSYGGAIAQFYAIKYPQAVTGMILVGAVPMLSNPEIDALNLTPFYSKEETERFGELMSLAITGKLTLPQFYFNKDINGGWKRQSFYKPSRERLAQAALYDIAFDPRYSSDFKLYDFKGVFENCPLPTLICEGQYDSVWSAKKIPLIRKNHPNAQFKLFSKSSHDIYSDEPDLFIKTLIKWTKALQPVGLAYITAWQTETKALLNQQLSVINDGKTFLQMIKAGKISDALQFHAEFERCYPGKILFSENTLNALAYQLLGNNQIDEAIQLFELNSKEYPQSWNVWDSLGEAWLKKGDRQKALLNYRKSLELNSGNAAARKIVEELSKQ